MLYQANFITVLITFIYLFLIGIFLIRTDIALLFYFLLRPIVDQLVSFEQGAFIIGSLEIKLGALFSVTFLLLSVFYWILKGRNPFFYKISRWIALFTGYCLFTVLLSPDFFDAFISTLKIVSWLFFIPLAADIYYNSSKKDLYLKRVSLYASLGLLVICLSISGYKIFTGMGGWREIRGVGETFGAFTNPAGPAYSIWSLSSFLLLAVGLYLRDKGNIIKILSIYSIFMFSFFTLFFTFSRTALICIAISMLATTFLSKFYRTTMCTFLLIIIFLGSILAIQEHDSLQTRWSDLKGLSQDKYSDSVGSGRFLLWRHAWSEYTAGSILNQLIGYGFGSEQNVMERRKGLWSNRGEASGLHSDFFTYLTAIGLFGIILFYLVIAKMFLSLYKMRNLFSSRIGTYSVVSIAWLFSFIIGGILTGLTFNVGAMSYLGILFGTTNGVYERLHLPNNG